jgi:hypothetical protein
MSDIIPNIFLKDQAEKLVDFPNDTMKLALLSGTYDECSLRDTVTYNQLSAYEVPPFFGYSTGGIQVGHKTVVINDVANELIYDVNDIGMTVSGGTFGPVRYGVMYNLNNSNHLVYIFDFGENRTVNDGAQFKIKIDDRGLMKAKQLSDC